MFAYLAHISGRPFVHLHCTERTICQANRVQGSLRRTYQRISSKLGASASPKCVVRPRAVKVIIFTMEKLIHDARALFNVHITGRQVMALLTYEKELMEWNQKFNLTAIRDVESIRLKHFLDSFSCVLAWGANPPASLIDVGTGAGFPGLVLKILYPNMKLTLVESVGKKVTFCQHIVDVLGLEHVNLLKARAEEVGQDRHHREKYDWAVARAR